MKTYPNLRHARLFCACLSLGSVTRAAEMIGVSQPAASQALARLEDIFGAALFDMTDGRPTATEAGRIVAARTQRALDLIRAGCARLRHPSASIAEAGTENLLSTPQLRAISAFAEGGSFSSAARVLQQSQPAVHKMARSIEASLQQSLFEGAGRSIHLSNTGMAVARWARLALNEFESAAADVRELRGSYEGEVLIGALPFSRTSLVPDAITQIAARHPKARFSIAEGPYDDMLHDLEMGRLDILVGAMRRDFTSASLVQSELFTYRLSVVARAGHPLAGKRNLTLSDLAEYPWIAARRETPSRALFQKLAARFPEDKPVVCSVETGSLVAARGILMNTDHLALLSDHQAAYEIRAGILGILDFDTGDAGHMIGITTRKHWLPTMLQSEFIRELHQAAATGDPDLSPDASRNVLSLKAGKA